MTIPTWLFSEPGTVNGLRARTWLSATTRSPVRICCAWRASQQQGILSDFRALGDEVWQRFQADKEDTLWYYREVTTALIRSGRTRLVDELERVFGEIERLAETGALQRIGGGSPEPT